MKFHLTGLFSERVTPYKKDIEIAKNEARLEAASPLEQPFLPEVGKTFAASGRDKNLTNREIGY